MRTPVVRLEKLVAIREHAARAAHAMGQLAELLGSLRLDDLEVESAPEAKPAPAAKEEEKAQAPKPLSQAAVQRAAAHRFHHHTMPDWLPVIGEADRKRITRAVEAFATAAKESNKVQAAAIAASEPPAPTSEQDVAEFGSMLPKPGEKWSSRPKKVRRLSYRGALQQYREQHGEELVQFVLSRMLPADERTAHALHQSFKDFLGRYATAAEAGAAFAKSQKRTPKSEGDAIGQLRMARHQHVHEDGSVSVWSHCVKPGDAPQQQGAQA